MRGPLLALGCVALARALPAAAPKYVFHVIVDDLAFGAVSFHSTSGPEAATPHMDALVSEGVLLERFYVHHMCTPSRSAFMSGRLPMHVQQGLPNPEDSFAGVPFNMTGLGVKMKAAGYATAWVGKWDLGMATERHTPHGRGFDESLIYYEHKNSYWDQTLMQSSCQAYNPIVDLWSGSGVDDMGAPARHLNGTGYEEYLFRDRVQSIITAHDVTQPLFLVYTPHVAHCPLQVPADWLARFNLPDDETACEAQTPYIYPGSGAGAYKCRSQYHAMVGLLDEVLGNITSLLKAKGMWEDTLMVLSSDNGGPVGPTESGGTNFPLRGGKYSDWEGGIRVAAFASGGFIPPTMRGTRTAGIVHIADWYGTYCALAGVDPTDHIAAAAGLPPVDSMNVWPLLSSPNATSPRTEIPVSGITLIQGRYKLMLGAQIEATWGGPAYPNSSSVAHPVDPGPSLKCGAKGGCLYDVVADMTEHDDIASAHPKIVSDMTARLNVLKASFYDNDDDFSATTVCPPDIVEKPCGCWAALHVWGGFFGPWAWSPYNGSAAVTQK